MKRIGSIKHENYNPDKLEILFQNVEIAANTNQRQDYEMVLDGLKIIPRTSDPEKFDSFSRFITQDSECLTVYFYYGASKQYDAYFFYFKGVPPYKLKQQSRYTNTLGNLNAEEYEKEQRDKILKELHFEKLEKENIELKIKLEETEAKFNQEQEHWENIKKGKIGSYGEIGSAILTSLLNNPNFKKMFPFLSTFTNASPQEQDSSLGKTPADQTASFKPKGEAKTKEQTESDLSEEDNMYLQLLKDLKNFLNEEQFKHMIEIISQLALNPDALISARKHVQDFLNNRKKA